MHHDGDHVVHGLGAGETVGVGKQVAFQAGSLGIKIADQGDIAVGGVEKILGRAEPGKLHHAGNVVEVVTLGNGDGVDVNVAAGETIVNLTRGGRLIELVLTRLEGAAESVMQQQEGVRAADDASGLQVGGNATAGGAGPQQDEFCPAGLDGQVERPGQPDGGDENEDQKDGKRCAQHGLSLDDCEQCAAVSRDSSDVRPRRVAGENPDSSRAKARSE